MIATPANWMNGMRGKDPDGDARPDRRVQLRIHLAERVRAREHVVTRHPEAEADRRGHDREAAHEDRSRDDEQEDRRERVAEVRVDDLRRSPAFLDRDVFMSGMPSSIA